jgi:hypothetical protein
MCSPRDLGDLRGKNRSANKKNHNPCELWFWKLGLSFITFLQVHLHPRQFQVFRW